MNPTPDASQMKVATSLDLAIEIAVAIGLAGSPYAFTAKRFAFTYTRLIERGGPARGEVSVYGYANENGNEDGAEGGA